MCFPPILYSVIKFYYNKTFKGLISLIILEYFYWIPLEITNQPGHWKYFTYAQLIAIRFDLYFIKKPSDHSPGEAITYLICPMTISFTIPFFYFYWIYWVYHSFFMVTLWTNRRKSPHLDITIFVCSSVLVLVSYLMTKWHHGGQCTGVEVVNH